VSVTPEYVPAVAIALLVAVTAGVTDLQNRTVPNRLTLPAAAAGCALWPFTCEGPHGIATCAASAVFTFALCWAVWRANGWGGGDAKLVTALGCLLPVAAVSGGASPFVAVFFGWLAICLAGRHVLLWFLSRRAGQEANAVVNSKAGRPLAPVILAALVLHIALPAPWAVGVT